jgi:heme-degrading monooxygenase HmoA
MYARVTVVQGSPDKIDAGVESFNQQILPTAKKLEGFKAGFLLVDRSTGKGMGITMWDSEEARAKGAEALAEARAATIQTMGGTVPPVDEYEVVASHL